ncbi:MAG: PHP domain-containing protein [Desulfarculus sp.]|nr:MAG: PHP domain-containing protein [Desulfarculus sp.]
MTLIDLHTHTTASDGSLSPAALVAAAQEAGLAAVAVTDHDSIAGLAEALAAGQERGLEVVPGVEISLQRPGGGSMHLLGLWVDPEDPGLNQGLAWLQRARAQRNPRIVDRLNGLGVPLTLAEVQAAAAGGQVGRPHFAQVLVDKGVAANRQEAFGRFLKRGAPAYVDKARFAPAQGLALLRAAGGLPVLAHPGLLDLHPAVLEELLRELKGLGLEGLEAYYSEHDPALERRLLGLAARLELAVSGGSDFHGGLKPDIRLGTGLGTLRVPAALLAGLKARRRRMLAGA